jgi:hypothetical protein
LALEISLFPQPTAAKPKEPPRKKRFDGPCGATYTGNGSEWEGVKKGKIAASDRRSVPTEQIETFH